MVFFNECACASSASHGRSLLCLNAPLGTVLQKGMVVIESYPCLPDLIEYVAAFDEGARGHCL